MLERPDAELYLRALAPRIVGGGELIADRILYQLLKDDCPGPWKSPKGGRPGRLPLDIPDNLLAPAS